MRKSKVVVGVTDDAGVADDAGLTVNVGVKVCSGRSSQTSDL